MKKYFLIIKGNEFNAKESADKHGISLAIDSQNHRGETYGFAYVADSNWAKIYNWFNESNRDSKNQFVVGTLLWFQERAMEGVAA